MELKERLLEALLRHWPLLLSAGLVMVELRRIRVQLTAIGDELVRSGQESNTTSSSSIGTRRLRRASTSATSIDEWYSVYGSEQDELEDELSDDDKQLIETIDRLHHSSDEGIRDAWDLLKEADHSRSIELLWRKARAQCSMYGQFRAGTEMGDNVEKRKEFAQRGLFLAEEVIRRAPKLNHGHRYKAAALGCNMEFVGTSEKVMNGKVIKECTEEAIRLNPNDGSAHYILGRFYSELLKLPWMVRSMAAKIGIPNATPEDALRHFEASKGTSGHDHDVGVQLYKLYVQMGRHDEARAVIEWAVELPVIFKSDAKFLTELEEIRSSF